MDNATTVRPANSEDFPAVLALLRQLWPGHPLNEAAQRSLFHDMLALPHQHLLLVAQRGGKPAGFLSATYSLNAFYGGRLCYISALVVDTALRGSGAGGALVEEMERLAKQAGCVAAELDSAFPREAAHRFYEARGYHKQGYSFTKGL